MFEDLPILLHFEIKNNKLILRLDNKGLRRFENDKNAISKITLTKTEFEETDLVNRFKELIGLTFEYEIYPENDRQVFEFWGDYGCDSAKIAFDSCKQAYYEYSEEDLYLKGKILSESFSDLYERFNENESAFYKITNKLKTEIRDEITRFERKADFFQDKSSAFQQAVKSLKRLLNIIS